MAQQWRKVYAKTFEGGQFSKLTHPARLLFLGTITLADDDGRLRANPAFLRSKIFPYDDKVGVLDVSGWLNEIVKAKLVLTYTGNGEQFIVHPKWNTYQYVRKDMYQPSQLPPPPETVTKQLQPRNEDVTDEGQGGHVDKIDKKEKIRKINKISKERESELMTLFEDFWKAYPKRKGRGAAEGAFLKVNPSEKVFAEMLAAVDKEKKSEQWQKQKGQFIPHPATWLNQKRWMDENETTTKRIDRF